MSGHGEEHGAGKAGGGVTGVQAFSSKDNPNEIDRFLKLMKDRGASDLHMSVGRPPMFRLGGSMSAIRYRVMTDEFYDQLIQPMTPPLLWEQFSEEGDADFAYEVEDLARFRVNLFQQERGKAAVFRIIPTKLLTVKQLGLPSSVRRLTNTGGGIVLVTGPTGSGKSTTLAAIIHEMNRTQALHIVTIEDPIEFVHENMESLVNQREVGTHSETFAAALKAVLRQDPNVILVGEMRDLETIELALTAAETGLTVFATLHTNSAAKTIDRIVKVFPAVQQVGVRSILAGTIKGIVAQQLLRRKGGGRAAAIEIMFGTPAISSLIREGKTYQISGLIQTGKSEGMIAMDDTLRQMVMDDVVDPQDALEKAIDKDTFRAWLADRGISVHYEDVEVGSSLM